jgi:hypothetical protein
MMEESLVGQLSGYLHGEFGSSHYVPIWQSFVGPVMISCCIYVNPINDLKPFSLRILVNHEPLASVHANQSFSFTISDVHGIGVIGVGQEAGFYSGKYCLVLHGLNGEHE